MTRKPEASSGQIFTFYSYKGGTGRSMALANVGVLLAQKWSQSRNVLLIDWDLEAPGLHQFFDDRLLGNVDFESQLGLIDLFYEFKRRLDSLDEAKAELGAGQVIHELDLDNYLIRTSVPSLYLMTAGRFDKAYSSKVNSFSWEDLFNRFPSGYSHVCQSLARRYRYVLVNSRTGVTDTSGICTTLLPEKLVLVFTPNKQSLTGILDLIGNATEYRKQSDDLRPLIVFPLVSRVNGQNLK